jgi:phage shock protein E
MNWNILILGAVLALGYFVFARIRAGSTAPKATVTEKIKGGALVLDVRGPAEFAEGAYPGARNIPVDDLPLKLAGLGDKATPIVVYCASGARSSRAAVILRSSGFSDVTNAGSLASMPR